MRKLFLLCLATILVLNVPSVWAQTPAPTPSPQPTAVPRGVIVSVPANNSTVRGRVRIFGSAWVDNFQKFEVHLFQGSQDTYLGGGSQPIINGLIYEWNTADFKDGAYVLEIRAVQKDGNYPGAVRINVRVDNTTPPTPTPSPTEGATATPEPTRTPFSVLPTVTPQRTATPSSTPTAAAPTSILSGLPTVEVDPMVCVRPMLTGAAIAAAFFGLIALLAIIRKLLRG
jgi:hypothetical protein